MNIGLVLSGGMAKGAYQIGVLKALNNLLPQDEIKYLSCASIGVLNGYAYATGNLPRAEAMWEEICNNDKRSFITTVLRSEKLQESIQSIYTEAKRDLPCSFYCPLLDLGKRNIVYRNLLKVEREQMPLYLKASVAIPVFNKAVALDNTKYYDGALVDIIPIYPLIKKDLDYVLCVYFDDTSYKFENATFDSKTIKITFPSDTLIRHYAFFEKDSIREMISEGYEKTTAILSSYFQKGYDNLDYIYKRIEADNRTSDGKLRITGDILATNMNKVTQMLTKRNIY